MLSRQQPVLMWPWKNASKLWHHRQRVSSSNFNTKETVYLSTSEPELCSKISITCSTYLIEVNQVDLVCHFFCLFAFLDMTFWRATWEQVWSTRWALEASAGRCSVVTIKTITDCPQNILRYNFEVGQRSMFGGHIHTSVGAFAAIQFWYKQK